MFAQLFITAQVARSDVQELLQHETRRELPSLSKEDEICSGNKADLPPCLIDDREFSTAEPIT